MVAPRFVRVACVAPALITASALAAQSAPPPTDTQLAMRTDEYMTRLATLGYTGGVLVIRNGRTVFARSYGMANRDAGIPADASTVYNLGSITKQFTAAAILRLEELGKLHTTDAIGRFFPDAPADKRGITLHQLLTHTAGFASDFSPTDYEPTTRADYVRRMFMAPLRSAPGTAFSYANSGYSLLAAIVEIASGKDYELALRDLILRPAGMLETGYKAPAWNARRIAHGYQDGRDWGTIVDRIAPAGAPYWELRGNGGLHTTLGDIASWDAALDDSRMLSDSSRRKFMTGYVNEGPQGLSQYAYGWAVMKTSRGTRLVTHNGGNGVYVAELLRFVDDRVTIFVTSTVSGMTATNAARVVSRIAFGEPYDLPPARAASASSEALAGAAGTYRLSDGSRLVLRVQDGKLTAEAVGQQAWQLLATGDTASPPGAAALNTRSVAIVEALVNADIRPLLAALDGGSDSATVAGQESQLRESRRERFGAFRSVELLGTTRGGDGGLETTVRVSFERGAGTNIYSWSREGRIMDIRGRPFTPVELIAAAGGEFRTFDPQSGSGLRLRVARTGAVRSVVVETPRGPLTIRAQE